MNATSRWKTWGTLLGVVAALSACGGKHDKGAQKGRMVAAGPSVLRDAVRFSGSVEPVTQVDLKAEISGRILSLPAKEGAMVKKGAVLVQLDPEPYQLKVDRAVLAVDRAKLTLSTAVRDLQRSKSLLSTGTVSNDAVEDLDVARRKAELELRDAELQLREARKDLADAQVRATMDGQLISLDVEEGEMVAAADAASGGTTLGVIADPSKMQVEVEVGELDYPRLKLGMPVEVSSGSSDDAGKLAGTVTFISSSARASSGSSSVQVFPVKVAIDAAAAKGGDAAVTESGKGGEGTRRHRDGFGAPKNAGGDTAAGAGTHAGFKGARRKGGASLNLVAGMTVAVDFLFMERSVPVSVPQSAIQKGKGKGGSSVMVKGADGKTVSRVVRVGATDYRHTEILEGLAAGDSVLVPEVEASQTRFGPGGP